MRQAISHRKGIPFYYPKSALEFQKDIYEQYHEMVLRQSLLHNADSLWGSYPFQPVLNFAEQHYPQRQNIKILEIGCGVGRWISNLAKRYPDSTCWGIDYSYQMLKRANEFWIAGKELILDGSDRGLGQVSRKGEQIENLKLGLSKAENLPFDDNTQDLVVSSFLLDRLEEPRKGLLEMHRVLKTGAKLIVVSPLNFQQGKHWDMYYPSGKISELLKEIGFMIVDWEEAILVNEPIDRHGNILTWKCLGFVVEKIMVG